MVDVSQLLKFDRNDVSRAQSGQDRVANTGHALNLLNRRAGNYGRSIFEKDERLFVSMDGNLGYCYRDDHGETHYALIMELTDDVRKINSLPQGLQDKLPIVSLTTIPMSFNYNTPIRVFRSMVSVLSDSVESLALKMPPGYGKLNGIEMSNNYLVNLKEFGTVLNVKGDGKAKLNLSLKTSYTSEMASFTTGDFYLSDEGLCPSLSISLGTHVTAALAHVEYPNILAQILAFKPFNFDASEDDYEYLDKVYELIFADEPWAAMKGALLHASATGYLDPSRKQALTKLCRLNPAYLNGLIDALDSEWSSDVIPDSLKSEITATLMHDGFDFNGSERQRKMKI